MPPKRDRIFVQIASYRDPECQWTVQDLFAKAAYPERIFVGICWQSMQQDNEHCFAEVSCPPQVRLANFDASESKGLGWARQQAMKLWDGEEYVLQIDSHMRFVPGWDQKLLDMAAATGASLPVLTVYPPGYTPPDKLEISPPLRVQVPARFNRDGVLAFEALPLPRHAPTDRPFPAAGLAGGFLFAPAHIVDAVKPDPQLYFFGEEVSLAVRLWTHGFDLFSPNEHVLYHYYGRQEDSKHWEDNRRWHALHMESLARLRTLLEPANTETYRQPIDLEEYGLGNARTLVEYEQFSGVNFTGRTIAQHVRSYPFVMTGIVVQSILGRAELKPARDAHLFLLGDEGVLFSESTGDFARLNTSATYIWYRLTDGINIRELIGELVKAINEPPAQVEKMLAGLLTHWEGQRFLASTDQREAPAPLQPANDEPPENYSDFPSCPAPCDGGELHFYRLLDTVVRVHYLRPEHAAWVHPVLAHMEVVDAPADYVITTAESENGLFAFLDHKPALQCEELSQLAPLIKFKILSLAGQAQDYLLNVHAGAVSGGERCLLLPAAAGSGKTSLTAALINAGYRYFSDETALLDRSNCHIRPVPLALTVKTTGRKVLEDMYPALRSLPVHERSDDKSVQYLPPPAAAPSMDSSLPVSTIVFPQYTADKAGSLVPLSDADALGRILKHSVAFRRRLTLADARQLVSWIRTVDCFALSYQSFDEALAQIAQITASER
ncbi:MAG: PqqD family peptide modification chaperone [Pseudomonadota bacterium]